jgi:1,6-anhydro-N-acetylmuramate kinase
VGHKDGVDLAHVLFTQDSMPQKVKRKVMQLIKENKTSPEEMAIVNIQLGQVVADAVNWFGQKEGFDVRKEVDIAAGQGQTVSADVNE